MKQTFSEEELDWICARRIANELVAIAPFYGLGDGPVVWTADLQSEFDELGGDVVENYDYGTHVRLDCLTGLKQQCRLNFCREWPFDDPTKAKLAFDYTYMGG